jgi:hypothetical protein
MAQAESSGHVPLPFVPKQAPSSDTALRAVRSRWAVGLSSVWFITLGLWILNHGSILLGERAFDRASAVLDATRAHAWAEALSGFVFIALLGWLHRVSASQRVPGASRGWDERLGFGLDLLALVAWTTYLGTLRLPWLFGTAGPDARLELWSRTLASTTSGYPLTAFVLVMALGVLLTHAERRFLGFFMKSGLLDDERVRLRAEVVVFLLTLALFFVGAVATVGVATGRF